MELTDGQAKGLVAVVLTAIILASGALVGVLWAYTGWFTVPVVGAFAYAISWQLWRKGISLELG